MNLLFDKIPLFKNTSDYVKGIVAIVISAVFILITAIVILPGFNNLDSKEKDMYSGINEICELASTKSFFHCVADSEKEADNPLFGLLGGIGSKRKWIEYDAIVKVGIDCNELVVEEPNSKGEVRITLPEAKVLSVGIDSHSISYPFERTGWFTSVTSNEQDESLSKQQENLKADVEQDVSLLSKSREDTKRLISNYVENVGEMINKEYHVVWIEK